MNRPDVSKLSPLNSEEFSLAFDGKQGLAIMKYKARTGNNTAQAQEVVRQRLENANGIADMFNWGKLF